MGTSCVALLSIILGSQVWNNLEDRSPTVFPRIMPTITRCGTLSAKERETITQQREAAAQKRKDLGLSAIPMYVRHLRENPRSPHFSQIMLIAERIDQHAGVFLPFATTRLAQSDQRDSALRFLTKFGRAADAKVVASLLLDPEFFDQDPRAVFRCLEKIGCRDETAVLTQYVVNRITRDPDQNWVDEASGCRKAIEARLEAEVKVKSAKK